jgi:hypothetical protein
MQGAEYGVAERPAEYEVTERPAEYEVTVGASTAPGQAMTVSR